MIDVSKIKDPVTIHLNACTDPDQICDFMKKRNIKKYVYAFISRMAVLKYGSSKDNEWKNGHFGDRIYRQAAYIPGWGKELPLSESGDDILPVINEFPKLTKNDVWVKVWDMTDYPFLAKDTPIEVEQFENEKIQEYYNLFGCRPIGNPKDTSSIAAKTIVADATLEGFVELEIGNIKVPRAKRKEGKPIINQFLFYELA